MTGVVDSLGANELKISYAIFVPYIIQISQNLTTLQSDFLDYTR